ncbi:MAG: adenylate cyclase [Candidatus Acidoferrum typicum]|nr:adenylate cyclase [Candidatus Acidoferrum typicum]
MGKEREIKLGIADLPALRRALRKLGARLVRPRLHERNVLFDTPGGSLASREQLLRIRTELPVGRGRKGGPRSLVTFKRPLAIPGSSKKNERHKVREEIELEITDPKALAMIFEGLGMQSWFQYEKFRTTFRLPASNAWAKGLLIEVDETPIGVFLELEGPANAIDRAAKALGFETSDYVLANYMVLYREYCRERGEEPRDMLFAKSEKKTPRR